MASPERNAGPEDVKVSRLIPARHSSPDTQHPAPGTHVGRAKTLWASFGYAWEGIRHSFRTQRNFRIHVSAALLASLAGWLLAISALEWAVVALLVVMVLAAEMVNTMVEALVDLVTQDYHPLAKVAKDVAAGVVLLTAVGAVVVGALIFLPKLLAALRF
jgi:diacylglycerol kinase (ATP)